MMKTPTLKEIDEIRKQGFRPGVVGCFTNQRRVLLLFSKQHELWQLPQGGIDNQEGAEQGLVREMTEELGEVFFRTCEQKFALIGHDRITFPPETQGGRDLVTDQGEPVKMRGKHYFFYAIRATSPKLDIDETEFNAYRWCSYKEGVGLANQIFLAGKRRVTLNVLNLLKKISLIQ